MDQHCLFTNAGDGLGDKTGLYLTAVMLRYCSVCGTNIKEETVPMMLCFLVEQEKQLSLIWLMVSYRVARMTDTAHCASGNAQPFFIKNKYLCYNLFDPSDQGDFVKLGGNFDVATKQWITPRAFNHFIMTPTTNLTEIETGSDVIVLSN